ncbi:hypothetical protein BRPE67_ECDS03520 (plasmid) [Caballeronia cordobensis]|nr:hypothetical protein BRPE67_ECDS03520 [Burkholderia sp. RPE67]
MTALSHVRTGEIYIDDGKGEAASMQGLHHDVEFMVSNLNHARHGKFQR